MRTDEVALILLGETTYIWVGTEEGRLDTLAMAVPGRAKQPPGTTLFGGGAADGSSQSIATRPQLVAAAAPKVASKEQSSNNGYVLWSSIPLRCDATQTGRVET